MGTSASFSPCMSIVGVATLATCFRAERCHNSSIRLLWLAFRAGHTLDIVGGRDSSYSLNATSFPSAMSAISIGLKPISCRFAPNSFIRADAGVFCDQWCRVERLLGQPEVDAWQTDESFPQVAHA